MYSVMEEGVCGEMRREGFQGARPIASSRFSGNWQWYTLIVRAEARTALGQNDTVSGGAWDIHCFCPGIITGCTLSLIF